MNNQIQDLEFSSNFNNKLSCPCFSTLRVSGRFSVGQRVRVCLKTKVMGYAVCRYRRQISFGAINDAMAFLDTGYNAEKCRSILFNMYKGKMVLNDDTPIYFYVFEQEPADKSKPAGDANLFTKQQ